MKVSLIFTAETEDLCARALAALAHLRARPEDYEVLLALGRNPSAQRNEAAARAQGDWLLFLDCDSIVDPRVLHYYADALTYDDDINVVGGPALHRAGNDTWEQAMSQVFASPFGLGPFRSRYSAEGRVRPSTERELILCNMFVKRAFFLAEKGFNTDLYPNEENEFLNRVEERTRIYFHPLATVYRETPPHFGAYVKKMLRYGAGRAKHMLMFPKFWDNIFLLPAVFALLTAALPFLWARGILQASPALSLPFLVYAALAVFSALFPAVTERRLSLLFFLPLLFFACHFFYGFGLLWGILSHPFRSRRAVPAIEVKRAKEFGRPLAIANEPATGVR